MSVLSDKTLSLSKEKFQEWIDNSSAKESSIKRYWRAWRKFHREKKVKITTRKPGKEIPKKPPKVSYDRFNITFEVKLLEKNTGHTWWINWAYKSNNKYLSRGEEMFVAQQIEDHYNMGKRAGDYYIEVLKLKYLATYDRLTGKRVGIKSPKDIITI